MDQYSVLNLSYNLNGNIQTLDRRGPDDPGGYIDRLTYTYTGNKLIAVEDAVPTHYNYDFRNGNVYSGADEYAYDANGNMTRDDNKGTTVTYNELNLPTEVDFGNDNRIEWVYSASGEKLRKTVYFSDGISVVKDYIGSFVYVDGVLDFFHTSEGRVEYDGTNFEYQYSIKDHLGNVRVLFADDGAGNAIIKQENHYYPYGLTLAGLGSTGGSDNKFLYNGKELEDEHNLYWYHYGARYYDPQLGLWHSIDPSDEFYSPYLALSNNPIIFVDPNGEDIALGIDPDAAAGFGHTKLYIQDENGKWFRVDFGGVGDAQGNPLTLTDKIDLVLGENKFGEARIQEVEKIPDNVLVLVTTKEQDIAIYSNAVKIVNELNSQREAGKRTYNLYNNSCLDVSINIIETAGVGILIPHKEDTDAPNTWWSDLMEIIDSRDIEREYIIDPNFGNISAYYIKRNRSKTEDEE